jgi:hypothetical protein
MEKVGMTYLQKIPEWELGEEQNWRIQYICLYDMGSREFKNLLNKKAAFTQTFGEEQVMDVLLRCYRRTMETAVAQKDEALFNTMKPVVDKLSPSAAEAKRTWLMEQMNFFEGVGNWKSYFQAAQSLFAQPGTLDSKFWSRAAWNAAQNGTQRQDWEWGMGWIERSLGMGRNSDNVFAKATLALKLGKVDQAEALGKEALVLAEKEGVSQSEVLLFLKKVESQQ